MMMNQGSIARWGRTGLRGLAIAISIAICMASCVLVLLLTGCERSPSSRRSLQLDSSPAMFISKQAPIALSLLAEPQEVLADLKGLGTGKLKQNILENTLKESTGLDYNQDIQPWLDGAGIFALTTPDIDRDRENGQQPGYLAVMPTKNPQLSQELLQVYWQREALSGKDLVFEPYKGTQLIYTRDSDSIATTVVGSQFVLLANSPKVLREAINNIQVPQLSLGATPEYQQLMERLTDDDVAVAMVNLPKLGQRLGIEVNRPIYEELGINLLLKPEGILAKTDWFTEDPEALIANQPKFTEDIPLLNYLPSSSFLVASGADLSEFWEQVETETSGYGVVSNLIRQPLLDLGAQWGVDLPEDILSRITGEYAIAFLPSEEIDRPDWAIIAETSDREQGLIEPLDEIANQQGYSTGSFMLDNQVLVAWTKLSTDSGRGNNSDRQSRLLQAKVRGVHTIIDGYQVITSSIAAMDNILNAKTGESLANDSLFQESIASLDKQNDGYFFLNWRSAQKTLKGQIPLLRLVELAAKPLFEPLETVTVASYGNGAGDRRADIFLKYNSP